MILKDSYEVNISASEKDSYLFKKYIISRKELKIMARKKVTNETKNVVKNETLNEAINLAMNQDVETEDALFYDPKAAQAVVDGLASISKEIKQSAVSFTANQARLIVDNYYATQRYRMNLANQIRAVKQGFDEVQEGEQPAIAWLFADIQNRENQIKKMIEAYAKSNQVCLWAMAIKGIGPVFAVNLLSYINIKECKHANQWLSYAGLNDNNAPWLGAEKANKLVTEAYAKFGLNPKDPITEDVLLYVATSSGRNVNTVRRGFLKHKQKAEENNNRQNDKTALSKYMAKPPYNTDLKKLCYLIGQSFIKVSNRGSLYGQIYKERKAYETMKNENGDYADQCARLLKEKNYDKSSDTYKSLNQGKLSQAHINMRAMRYAVKIFMTHFFEACYIHEYGTNPPVIYPIAFQDHADYIKPEIPYEDYFKINGTV